ncbi:MAG TPA: glycosyltransferase family 4 protein [Caulobacteraceae bacterium]|jgi:mannosyltransferase
MDQDRLRRLEVIIPNLHARWSGVTATNRAVAPRIAGLVEAAWIGGHRPQGVAPLAFPDLLRLRVLPPPDGRPRVWHARRNDEMIVGLLLKALGWRLKLVFTSAAQRRHKALTRWLIARMDAVIATSAASAAYLKVTTTVIHHGVDTGLYRPPANREAAWRETGLPGRFGIGCFGRVRRQKGVDVFVEALIRLLPRHPDFTGVIVGQVTPEEQGFADALKARIAGAGLSARIRFLGELPSEDLPVWFGRMRIYAFASRNEGFGLTLLEAMASGAALVATRAGAAEVVVEDGVTGVLVAPGEADAFTAALEPLMANPSAAEAMGGRAREAVLARHSIEAEAHAIVEVYRSVWTTAG